MQQRKPPPRSSGGSSVLTKVDRASMAHGLEARPPFLDEKVVALARRVPARDKIRGKTTKWLLRQALLVLDTWMPRFGATG